MTTILAFAGRSHHVHRLSAIMAALNTLEDTKAAWFSADNAVNNDPFTQTLIRHKQPFHHLLDYWQDDDTKAIGKATSEMLIQTYCAEGEFTKYLSPYWIAYSSREATEVIRLTRNLFNQEKPDVVMVLHEANFWTKCIAYLCHERGIPCVGFQEGLIRHRDQDTMRKQSLAAEYSTRLFVWSEYAKSVYLEAGVDETKLAVAGIAHIDEWLRQVRESEEVYAQWKSEHKASMGLDPSAPLMTFAPPQLGQYEGDAMRAINALATYSTASGVQLAIKLHPFEARETADNLKQVFSQAPYIQVIFTDLGILPTAAVSDIFVTQHSTVGLEAIALDVPLVELDLENVGVLQSYYDQGIAAAKVTKEDEMGMIGEVLAGDLNADAEKVTAWKRERLGLLDGNVVGRIVREIVRLTQ